MIQAYCINQAIFINRAILKKTIKRLLSSSVAALVLLCSFAICSTASAQAVRPARTLLPDLPLVDQDGRGLRFYSDLIKGKAVVINFIYTDCKAVCPMQANTFFELQSLLGDRLTRDVILISISADPESDTPERLKSWGAAHGAKPGWTLLTGERAQIDELTKALIGDVARKGEHTPLVFVGHADVGLWKRAYGLAEPLKLVKLIDRMIAVAKSRAR